MSLHAKRDKKYRGLRHLVSTIEGQVVAKGCTPWEFYEIQKNKWKYKQSDNLKYFVY